MKFYKSYFKLRFITGLQYRASALAGIGTQLFFGLVYILVYVAFYESSKNGGPMKLNELITYMWLGQAFFSLFFMYYRDTEIFEMIKNGNVSYELVRPKNLYFMWYVKTIAQRLSNVVLRFLPVIVVASLLPAPYNLGLPKSPVHFLIFLITLTIGALLMTAVVMIYPVTTMRTIDEKGITIVFMALADIFSGGVIPIPFFPKFMQGIANIFPFRYISDLPYRIYSGNIGITEGVYSILIQIIWLFLFIMIGNYLTKKNLRKVVVQGG